MTLPTQSPRVAELLKKMRANRGRLIFALDATASRARTWDMATQLQAAMFEEATAIGGLDVQLVYYRGCNDVRHSAWLNDTHELGRWMSAIRCEAGATQIAQILQHVQRMHKREKINAVVFVGDACEESPNFLYAHASNLGVPMFLFQEGNNEAIYLSPRGELANAQPVEQVFRELARLTNGAYGKFDAGAAKQLGELLRAVAAFAVGGITALAGQHTDSARLLLGQMK